MNGAIVVIIVTIVLANIIGIRKERKKNSNNSSEEFRSELKDDISNKGSMPFVKRRILTDNEYDFYKKMLPIIKKRDLLIFPKVGLKDIVNITEKDNYMKWFGKIAQKHIDFIICDSSLNILFGLELDDSSHLSKRAEDKDKFKDDIFATIGIPLKRLYNKGYIEIEKELFGYIQEEKAGE